MLRAVRPTYTWLSGSRLLGVYAAFRQRNQADAVAELGVQIAARIDGGEHATEALNLLTRMVIVTGKKLRRLDLADFTTYATQRRNSAVLAPRWRSPTKSCTGSADLPATRRPCGKPEPAANCRSRRWSTATRSPTSRSATCSCTT
ncbi:hypothetical protein [Actinoplanes sp. TFC3]|uniref:hypothetical protein n=1 Tax=Actinoplanes sp. TFC3 TaxID=1710355 RepID=UPI001379FCAA|nr:hypothetical protein [Actinoplanes sp. TFC3]